MSNKKTAKKTKAKHLQAVDQQVKIPNAVLVRPSVNTLTAIVDFDGNNVILHQDGTPATFRNITVLCLMETQEIPGLSQDQAALRAYHLMDRITRENNVMLSDEDASIIKKHVSNNRRSFNNLVIGRIYDILDGKAPTHEPSKEAAEQKPE